MKNGKLILGGLLGVLLIGGLIAATGLTREETKDWQPLDDRLQMRHGRLYALERLLSGYGLARVESKRSMFGLDNLLSRYRDKRLLVVADNRLSSSEDADRLLYWVGRGNHLVLSTWANADDNPVSADGSPAGRYRADEELNFRQAMLRGLRIGTVKAPEIDVAKLPDLPSCVKAAERRRQAAQQVGRQKTDGTSSRCNAFLSRVRLPEGATLEIYASDYSTGTVWVPQDKAQVLFEGQNAYGTQIIRVRHGNGSVLLIQSREWLDNPDLPDRAENGLNLFDHAYLATYLAQEKTNILLVDRLFPANQGDSSPVWWKMVKAQPVLWAIGLAFVLALVWRIAVRVGVVRRLPPAPERYLKQHLLAQGQFLTRHLSRRAILSDMQRKLLETLQQRHPAWKQMSAAKQAEFLCAQTGLPPSAVEPWLRPLPKQVGAELWLQMLASHRLIAAKINRSWY